MLIPFILSEILVGRDRDKSQSNKNKHGIDFIEAQALWVDSPKIEIPAQTTHIPQVDSRNEAIHLYYFFAL